MPVNTKLKQIPHFNKYTWIYRTPNQRTLKFFSCKHESK